MDLEKLKNRDYVIVLDRSGSMTSNDTPTGASRWAYARESVEAIANRCAEYDPDGITVIPFNSGYKVFENTTPSKIADIYNEVEPMGGTTLGPVLGFIFDSYSKRKAAGQTKANGELVLVITDGQPSDENEVAQQIVNFTKKLDNGDGEYGIQFFQVGKDSAATAFLQKLDNDLEKIGAKFDIVDTKTMIELETIGLKEALIAALVD